MPRKLLDVSRLHALGWRHRIDLRDGIASTYRWFVENQGRCGCMPSDELTLRQRDDVPTTVDSQFATILASNSRSEPSLQPSVPEIKKDRVPFGTRPLLLPNESVSCYQFTRTPKRMTRGATMAWIWLAFAAF